jgi:hypothetical protein
MSLETPVLFMVFNRPHTARRVLAAIRQARPRRLFVAADGPRSHRSGDYEQCQAVRDLLRDGIDWDCELHTLLRQDNLGCKLAISSAINWFFEQVDEGIILEDDTVPSPDFFPFCASLLERYRHNPAVMHVSGDNFQFGRRRGLASYYYSIYNHNWGWGSWRRAWKLYDGQMSQFEPHRGDRRWLDRLGSDDERYYWQTIFDRVARGEIDTWDYQWTWTMWLHGGCAVLPNANLVSNIGHGAGATHTTSASPFGDLPTEALPGLVHPTRLQVDTEADRFAFEHVFLAKPAPLLTRAETWRAWLWRWRQKL